MTKTEHAQLAVLLAEIAECFDRRPLAAAAIKHWIDALQEFPWSKVQAALLHWRDRKSRFPAIADIREPLAEHAIDEREATAEATRVRFERELQDTLRRPTPEGLRIIEAIKRAFSNKGPADYRKWARDIVDAYVDHRPLMYKDILSGEMLELTGKPISLWQLQLGCEALGLDTEKIIRDSKRVSLVPKSP